MQVTNKPVGPSSGATVYGRIEIDMRSKVELGTWPPGMMIPSRKALSKAYGVDLRTVQRAIAALLGDGTLTAENGRGTFVARVGDGGRNLASWIQTPALQTVAIVLDQSFSPTDPGPRAISQAIHASVRAASPDTRILTFDTHAESIEKIAALERDALGIVEHEGLAGAVVWHSGGRFTEPQLRRMVENGVPLVFMDRFPEGLVCDYVGIDNDHSAREAVEYLLSLGHRRIGFVAPMEPITSIEQRLAGYRKALRRAGVSGNDDLEFRPGLRESLSLVGLDAQLRAVADNVRAMASPPTAIVAVNDFLAHRLITALEHAGLSVPADVSVIGFDDIDRYSPRPPILTTMRQSFEAMGERAAEMLLARIAAPRDVAAPAYQHVLLSTKLIARESCRAL
jgi:DNA-binding LacI/PurR family transcriptional regulator/DNA-binding transcriptional regulator YhcF (GntR family)